MKKIQLLNNTDYEKVLSFAVRKHGSQKLKYPEDLPYFVHLACVSEIAINGALEDANDVDYNFLVQVALLHDVLEDTDTIYDEVEKAFGKKIADAVSALSKNELLDKSLQMLDSIDRIKKNAKEVWMVKLADRIFNTRVVPPKWSDKKVASYKQDAKLILDELGKASPSLSRLLEKNIKNYKK